MLTGTSPSRLLCEELTGNAGSQWNAFAPQRRGRHRIGEEAVICLPAAYRMYLS